MPRIVLPTPDSMTEAQLRVYEEIVTGQRDKLVGPLRAAIHRPDLADRWQKLGALLRFETTVSARWSELAILVTARRWNSQVEWYVHAADARRAGLPEAVILTIQDADVPQFDDPGDAFIYDFAVELQRSGEVTASTYHQVLERLGTVGIVELTAIIGYYTLVAMTLNAHEIPLPDGIAPPLRPVAATQRRDGRTGLTDLPLAHLVGHPAAEGAWSV